MAAGAQKVFSLVFQIQAAVGSNFNSSFTSAQNAARKLQNELSGINALQSKVNGYQKQAEVIEKSKEKLAALTEEQAHLRQAMSQTEQPSEALRRAYERNARQIEQTNASIQNQQQRLDELGNELRDAGVDTDRLTEENDRLADSYNRVRQNQERLAHLADAQQKNAAAISKTKARLAGTIGVISAVGAAIYAGPVQQSIKFQSSMAKVGTIADTAALPLNALQKDIVSLSNEIGVNANDIAEDVYNAISAGQKTEDAVGFVGQAVKLAKGGFAETGQALDVMTTILNAYGKESSEAGAVADMLIQTQNKGKVTVAELSSVMGKIIPTANANNVALEQLCAGYAIMTARGIAAAETTTYMNSMLNELGKTGTTADKTLRAAAGGSFKDLMAQGMSVAEVLDILQAEATKGGKSLADMFGSAEAGKAALTLMADGVDGFNLQVAGMLDSTGAAESAFKKMSETTEEKIAKAKNALNNLAIVLGDTFLPYVTTGAQKVSELVIKFSAWAQENPELLSTIVKIGAGIAAFAVGGKAAKLGFLEIKGGILSVATVFTKLKAMGGIQGVLGNLGGIKGIFSGIGEKLLPIAGIATGIAVAIKLISGNLDEVRGFIKRTFGDTGLAIFDKVWGVITNIGNAIKGVFSGGNLTGARNFFQNTFGEAGVAAFDAMIGVVEQLKAVLPGLLDQLGQMAMAIFPVIMNAVSALLPAIMQIVGSLLPPLVSLIGELLPVIMQIASAILQVITQLIQTIAPVITDIVNAVLPVLIDLFNTFMPIITQLVQAVLPVLQQILQALTPVITILAEIFGGVLGAAINSVSQIISGLMSVIGGLINFITGVFTGNWAQAWEGVKNIFKGIFDTLAGIVKAPINAIIGIINGAISGINKVGFDIPDWVPFVGGKQFRINIPQIPMLAKGSRNAPDTFIAGERGPELITNGKGRTVFTALQTERIMSNAGAAQQGAQQVIITLAPALIAALAAAPAVSTVHSAAVVPQMQAAELQAAPVQQGGTVFRFESAPVFNVNGGDQEEMRQMFEEYHDRTLQDVEEMQRQKEADERRGRYE